MTRFTANVMSGLVIWLRYNKLPTDSLYGTSPASNDPDQFGSNECYGSVGICSTLASSILNLSKIVKCAYNMKIVI